MSYGKKNNVVYLEKFDNLYQKDRLPIYVKEFDGKKKIKYHIRKHYCQMKIFDLNLTRKLTSYSLLHFFQLSSTHNFEQSK